VAATRFEFEYRFWIITGIYVVAFSIRIFDHVPFLVALRHLIAPSIVRDTPESATFARIVIAIGAVLVFFAVALRTWAAAYLQTAIVHDSSQHSEALVADGPFRYTRNPLYLGNLPLAVGIGVLASRLGFIFLVLANWLFVYRLIFREEEALRQTLGESYRTYLNAVPRFWPSLRPRVAASGNSPRWAQAFAGEAFGWVFGIAELSIAVTLNARLGLVVFLLAFVTYFIPLRLVRKGKKVTRDQ
jgi:protein-S-isoprenylcysteine O-methyltransferase Ste14